MKIPFPQVSVIIPCFNRVLQVAEAVGSVLAQDYSPYECIVVDDGSEDNTFESLSARFGSSIRLFRQENRGVSAARNRGIRESRGEYLAFLDSDDLWKPCKLSVQMDYMAAHPDLKICQTTETWFRKGKRVNPPALYRKINGDLFERSLQCCMITPSSVLLKRELLDEVGLFDEELPVCEDYDLWLRVTMKYPVGLIEEELLIRYGGNPDQLSARHSQDKYRIAALEKLLEHPALNQAKKDAVLHVLREKRTIYGKGCLKRGKTEEAAAYLREA